MFSLSPWTSRRLLLGWLFVTQRRYIPVPQCLVHRDDLHRLTCTYPDRTTASKARALRDAPDGPKTAREEHLKKYGLHDFPFANSDPYKAVGYDALHFWDGGHLSSATTIDYSEGQTFLDILKRVSEKHDKSLNFLKQHFLSHAVQNFVNKGTSRNQNTRVGEGFQQEVSAMYKITNGKNAEHQMTIIDENEETMARLDMRVEMWQKSQEKQEDELIPSADPQLSAHWTLGSPDSRVSPTRLERTKNDNPLSHFALTPIIQILPCKALYIEFQSAVTWRSERDILRCNPNFHDKSRYDSIIYTAEDDPLAMGQLALIFRCFLPHGVKVDLAMIRPTRTDCPVRERKSSTMFVALEHVVRGALLCPIFGASREAFYDMFLRINGVTCHLRCSLELVFKIGPTASPTWEMFILLDNFPRPAKTTHAAQASERGSRRL
ncbi:hypothetical protein B0H14DRAFT_3081961 [Mycena olivaceomarginata]|nr:hypothetical protein B0H14DRAFT_3081961 [Mycena olivaceomarginata]